MVKQTMVEQHMEVMHTTAHSPKTLHSMVERYTTENPITVLSHKTKQKKMVEHYF